MTKMKDFMATIVIIASNDEFKIKRELIINWRF